MTTPDHDYRSGDSFGRPRASGQRGSTGGRSGGGGGSGGGQGGRAERGSQGEHPPGVLPTGRTAPTAEVFTTTTSDAARSCVTNRLAQQAAMYPVFELDGLDTPGLNERDSGFAHAVYDAAIKRWITLAYLIERFTPKGFTENEPHIQAALIAGAAQILLLDRVPVHAAINEAVEWTKLAGKVSQGGFINAVLRKVASLPLREVPGDSMSAKIMRPTWSNRADEIPLSTGGALALSAAVLPMDPIARIAVATSHPSDLLRRWAEAWSIEEASRLAIHNLCQPPVTLTTQYAKPPVGDEFKPHTIPGSSVWDGPRDSLVSILGERNDIWIQDAASSLVISRFARAVALKPGMVIVDLCAGQGTKTRQLAAAFPGAIIVASDQDPTRARALVDTVSKIRASESDVPHDISILSLRDTHIQLKGRAHLVLTDVPCSNSGVLARRTEAKYRSTQEQLDRLCQVQRDILEGARDLLVPGGMILYSTCSIEREENEDQVSWAAQAMGMSVSHVDRTMPAGMPGEETEHYHDGAFSALLTS